LVTILVEVAAQQSKDKNYVLSRVYKQAGANENDVSQVNIQIQYLDGLGRLLQNVQVQQSPSGQDIISTSAYDAYGRLQKSYLPYTGTGNGAFHSGAGGEAETWYTDNTAKLTRSVPPNPLDVSRPYTQAFYEPSPLGRAGGEQEPGGFSNQSEIKYGGNSATDVKKYSYSGGVVASAGTYGAGTLSRIEQKDEQNHSVVDFRDKYGKLVCRQVNAGTDVLYTYYIYSDLLQLRAILQPNFQDDNSVINSAFTYDYDDRGRIIASQIPGRGLTETVYDNFDRPVMKQNANQAPNRRWTFIKYDAMNRVAFTGEIGIPNSTRATLQTQFNGATAHHETKQTPGIGYSLNSTLPAIQDTNVLNVQYYDNYDYPGSLPAQNGYSATKLDHPNGYSTGGKARLMGSATNFVTTSLYYDTEYRLIESVRELYDMGSGAVERVSYKYKFDIAPVVSEEKTEENVGGNAHSIVSEYTYDHADRLLSVKETVTAPGKKTKTAYTLAQRFSPVGNLETKWLHSNGSPAASGTKFRRRTNITSNIRGWRTDLNTFYKYMEEADELSYHKFNLSYWNGTKYSNGNISSQKWAWKDSTNYTDGLAFTYDDADRLRESAGLLGYINTESGITYDKNGNIKKLARAGYASDNLTYDYGTAGNRLGKITNTLGNSKGVKSAASDYEYDKVGNVTSDGNRGAKITYNKIDLPQTVTIGTNPAFTYTYDATGKKHRYLVGSDIIKYAGKFEYNGDNTLKRVSTIEGQVVPSADTLRFDYYLKDHLGNVRVVVDERGRTLQETDYYPYGLATNKDGRGQVMRDDTNSYLYNGKEKQLETGWIDYGARMYMPEIGRWGAVDPLAENSRGVSPFVYGIDNPVLMIDPDGMSATYNWSTGNYEDGGQVVSFESALTSVGVTACPPNCGPNQAKADATMVGGKMTPQISDGGIKLPNRENGVIKNADSKLLPHEQQIIDGLVVGLEVGYSEAIIAKAVRSIHAVRAAKTISAEGAVWAQRTYSGQFSAGGKFAGQSVGEVAGLLRNGALSTADVPINVVVRNGQTFILNTRSSAALVQAGIPRSAWNVVDQSGVTFFENLLTGQLTRNGLINGTNAIRQTGTNLILSH
jgi:RHS repeat-associated protein